MVTRRTVVNDDPGAATSADPRRGGANENTKIALSLDASVNGTPLKAGAYGLHFIPSADERTVKKKC